ncbi:MAG: hypothetical protein PHH48_09300 [Eubacteriales bacterium]|nr:hypothetical protein [Eubacteriales bacterium]
MYKNKDLQWFTELMKMKMLKHENENPLDMDTWKLVNWLEDEVKELKNAIIFETEREVMLESADVANMAYFIAVKTKGRQ